MWKEMGAGSTQMRNEKCFQHFVMSQFWGNCRQSRQSRQTCCHQKLESFRAKYLGLRYAQEAELQTVTSSANSSCKSKSNLHVHTGGRDWRLKIDLFHFTCTHRQESLTGTSHLKDPGKFYVFIYLYLFYLMWGSFIRKGSV